MENMEKKLLKLFDLQMFSEDPEEEDIEEDETPTEEEVEDSDVEDTEEDYQEDNEEEADFDDYSEEDNEEEEEQKEEPKKEEPKEESKEDKLKAQRQENYKNAQARLQRKQQEQQKKVEREAYVKGVMTATNGVNKYTKKPIVDQEDVDEYELRCKIDKEGGDPIEDYFDYVKQQNRARKLELEKEKEREEQERNNRDKEVQDFISEYGKEEFENFLNDTDFDEKFGHLIGKAPIADLWKTYKTIKSQEKKTIEKKVEDEVVMKEARRRASSGPLGNKKTKEKSIEDMTDEEFRKFSLHKAGYY